MSDLPPTDDPLDEAFAAYLRTCDAGELRSREEFLAQFPELADELKKLMEAADMIDHFASRDTSVERMTGTKSVADTIVLDHAPSGEMDADPAVTLPLANRAAGDPGPRLPYDIDGLYLLLEELGRGGMGVVYLAKQKELDRFVAVKMIRSGMLAGENEVRRFYIEAKATARLRHPGIVGIHHFGQHQGHYYFSMEYVRGTDLQRKLSGEMLTPRHAARYVRDVARAIHHAHQKGVLHRDLKPANVLIDEQDQIHITDFGLAKHMDSESSVTGSGAAVGTPHYMAPEQAGGQSDLSSRQSDVYSLGAILFACVTGRPPIVADTVMQTLVQVVHHPAPSVRSMRPEVPVDLETIIAKCLEKQPNKRYATAEALADELDAFLDGRPIAARPRSRAIKAWHWLEGVPLVGALSGRKVLHSSATHRRFQAALLLMLLLTPIVAASLFTMWQAHKDDIPSHVRIAGGIEGGVYNEISKVLAARVGGAHQVDTEVFATGGSVENRKRLLSGAVDLAPLQGTTISGDELRVVAPLFFEVLYVLANTESDIESIGDLRGHRVAIGADNSGSRATAEFVFESLGLADSVNRQSGDWQQLFAEEKPDAAMVCVGRGSHLISRLLRDGQWRIVPIPAPSGIRISSQHPALRVMTIKPDELPESVGITEEIPTVGTTAFLAALKDAPSDLVVAALDALYQQPSPPPVRLIPRELAAEWKELAFHQAARHYYSQVQ